MPLPGLPVQRVRPAGRAVLLELQPVPVVNLVLGGIVIPPLALRAGQRHHRSLVGSHLKNPVQRKLFPRFLFPFFIPALSNIKDGQAVLEEPLSKITGNRPACKRGGCVSSQDCNSILARILPVLLDCYIYLKRLRRGRLRLKRALVGQLELHMTRPHRLKSQADLAGRANS